MAIEWSEEMMKNWANVQQQYWNAWSNLVQNMPNAQQKPSLNTPIWGQGLEQWWNAAMPKAPADAQDVMARVTDMGKMFMTMAEKALQAATVTQKKPEQTLLETWMSMMENSFQNWGQQLSTGKLPEMGFGAGQMHLEGWQKVLKSMNLDSMLSTLPQGMGMGGMNMPNIPAFSGFASGLTENPFQSQLNKILSTPAVGFSREAQERLQLLGKQMMEYQEATQAYFEAFAKQGTDSMTALREKVAALGVEGKQISSLRELFDLWVDVNEEVYARFAMSDQYQVVYGDMINAFMNLKSNINQHLGDLYQAINLPTRTDIESVLKKQQDLKRENRTLQQTVKHLTKRIEQLEALAKQPSGQSTLFSRATAMPKADTRPTNTQRDDLTLIKGLGPKMSEKLYEMGINNFMQLSELALDQLAEVDKRLGSQGRILRDDWIGQAKKIIADTTKTKL